MEPINSPEAPAAIGPYCHAVRTGNLLFCSGQIPIDPAEGKIVEQGVDGQAKQVFANIKAVLATAGATLDNIVKATVFLVDMADFPVVNEIYAENMGDHKPARSTIQVAALPLGSLVEIEVIVELS